MDSYRIAPDTWVIPQIEPAGPGTFVSINSMVIAGAESVIVDTGTAVNRSRWTEQVFSIVDPADVRWIFISHADRDHIGNLDVVLDACPDATVVSTYWGMIAMLGDGMPPLARMRWVNHGESIELADRRLVAVTPPLWDAPNTRGLYDPKTGVYWAADAFGSLLTHPVTNAADLDAGFWRESVQYHSRSAAPWHALLDPEKFDRHVALSAALTPSVVASAHGAPLTGGYVDEGFRLVRELSRLDPVAQYGQPVLDALVAAIAAESPADAATRAA